MTPGETRTRGPSVSSPALLMILKKGLLTELEGEKKDSQKAFKGNIFFLWGGGGGGRACFGWVGRSTTNQHFFRSA